MKYRFLLSLGFLTSLAIFSARPIGAEPFSSSQRMAGFSADSEYYVYLESSRDTGAGIPTARLQLVDLSESVCVQNGCLETQYRESDSGLSLSDAENDLLRRTWSLRQSLQLTPPVAGMRLNILSRSRLPNDTEIVNLTVGDRPLRLELQQRHIPSVLNGGTADLDRAAMRLAMSYNGQQQVLGSLTDFREGVMRYSIRSLYLAPDSDYVVVLITATEPTFEGVLETTVVQSFDL